MRSIFIFLFCLFQMGALSFGDSLDKIAKEISKTAHKLKNKQIAVLPFPSHDGREGKDSTIISERLVTKIASRKKLQVIERSLLEKVFGELKLQYTGAISQESAKKLGNILGVEAIVTGTIIDLNNNQIEINARLINAETGLVLSAVSETETRSWQAEEPAEVSNGSQYVHANGRAKMSDFFHSRNSMDSRARQEEGEEDPPKNFPADGGIVLSNRGEGAAKKPFGKEEIVSSPDSLLNEFQAQPYKRNPMGNELGLAWNNLQDGNLTEAKKQLAELKKRLNGRTKGSLLVQLYLAECYFREGLFNEAIQEARPAAKMENFPKIKANALYLIARSLEKIGRLGVANGLYREIIRNYPFDSRLIRAAGHHMRYSKARQF